MNVFFKKLRQKRIWKRIFYERLTEPIHLNMLSCLVRLLGSYRAKVNFDLIVRAHNAYSILKCADVAKSLGIKTVSIIEFGVAMGAGLMNMSEIAKKTTKETGVFFKVYGFDTGRGMPQARDYRDHPDLYQEGDYIMNVDALTDALPENTRLIIGNISETIDDFLTRLSIDEPIGYVVLDVDYYSSAKDALRILKGEPEKYLPSTIVYLDDIHCESHNSYCGELLAVKEFNVEEDFRKIEHNRFFENSRIFRRVDWIKHIYHLHVLDHPVRFNVKQTDKIRVEDNPYLS